MESLNGATIFWLIALGMLIGAAAKVTMWKTTVSMVLNIAAGVAGALVVGILTIGLQLPGGLLFAILGSISIIFIVNVFHLESETAH